MVMIQTRVLGSKSAFADKIRQAGAEVLAGELDRLGEEMVTETRSTLQSLGVNLNRSDSGERHGVRLADSFDYEVNAGNDFPMSVALTSSAPHAKILNSPIRKRGYVIRPRNGGRLSIPPSRSRHAGGWTGNPGQGVMHPGSSKGAGFARSAVEKAVRRFLASFR